MLILAISDNSSTSKTSRMIDFTSQELLRCGYFLKLFIYSLCFDFSYNVAGPRKYSNAFSSAKIDEARFNKANCWLSFLNELIFKNRTASCLFISGLRLYNFI